MVLFFFGGVTDAFIDFGRNSVITEMTSERNVTDTMFTMATPP